MEINKLKFQKLISGMTDKNKSNHEYNALTYQPYVATAISLDPVYGIEKKTSFQLSSKFNPGTIYDDYNNQVGKRNSSIQAVIARMKQNSKDQMELRKKEKELESSESVSSRSDAK